MIPSIQNLSKPTTEFKTELTDVFWVMSLETGGHYKVMLIYFAYFMLSLRFFFSGFLILHINCR